jgi:50S ribosomal protein L16 3-hydroxylase
MTAGMPQDPTILSELLGSIPEPFFLEEYYQKLPFARVGGCRQLIDAADLVALMRIIAQPHVDALVGSEGKLYQGPTPKTADDAERLLNDGYTLGVRRAEKHDAAIARLAQRFREAFAAPINIHLYCTPASFPGFGWHYDAEEVFILQTVGDKEWFLRKNTVNPWPLIETIPANQRYEREIMPVMHCKLAAGDWLYSPSGYWHRTTAPTLSVSLSVGIQATTAIELLQSMLWRQRLPPTGRSSHLSAEEQLQAYRKIATELAQDLQQSFEDEQLVRAFLEQLHMAADSQL